MILVESVGLELLILGGFGVAEIARRPWSKQNPGNQGQEQNVDHKLPQWMKDADSDVKGNPRHSQPSRPVLSTEHERSTEDCRKLGELDRDRISRKGPGPQSLVPVTDETGDSHCQIKDGNDRY